MSKVLRHPKLQGPELMLLEPLTRHIEAMQLDLAKLLADNVKGMQLSAQTVRAALRCGMLVGAEEQSVSEWSPALTLWVSSELSAHISAALEVPPE